MRWQDAVALAVLRGEPALVRESLGARGADGGRACGPNRGVEFVAIGVRRAHQHRSTCPGTRRRASSPACSAGRFR